MIAAPPVADLEVRRPDGRVLRAYDTGRESGTSGLTVVWHHGSPQTGRLPAPLHEAAVARGIRVAGRACSLHRPRDGHISVLEAVPVTLDWLLVRR